VEFSRQLISRGYALLKDLVENSADKDWLKPVHTPFFGRLHESDSLSTLFFIHQIMQVRYPSH
jgi:hypothetical protein